MRKFVLPLLFLIFSSQSSFSEDNENQNFAKTMRILSGAALTSAALIPVINEATGPVRTLAKVVASGSAAFLLNELSGRRVERMFRDMFTAPKENKKKIAATLTLLALVIYAKRNPPRSVTLLWKFLNTLGKGIKI